MPSVVGLLEQRECAARRRVDELREKADQFQAELAAVERDENEWVITCSRVGKVPGPGDGGAPTKDHPCGGGTGKSRQLLVA